MRAVWSPTCSDKSDNERQLQPKLAMFLKMHQKILKSNWIATEKQLVRDCSHVVTFPPNWNKHAQ